MLKSKSTNPYLIDLIKKLKKTSIKNNVNIWKAVAKELERPSRIIRIVNIERINRVCKDNDTIVVPGKVLASGNLNKKLTVAAFTFSESALNKINKTGKAISIEELININPKGSNVRIIG